MTELIAYRYKQIAADGFSVTDWTPWRSGRLRGEMMAELRERRSRDELIAAQCAVPRSEPDPIDGRENDLWEWNPALGWRKTNSRNWFVDSCDPTHRYDTENINEPFEQPISKERLDYWHKKLYGSDGVEDITAAIEADEMTTD